MIKTTGAYPSLLHHFNGDMPRTSEPSQFGDTPYTKTPTGDTPRTSESPQCRDTPQGRIPHKNVPVVPMVVPVVPALAP